MRNIGKAGLGFTRFVYVFFLLWCTSVTVSAQVSDRAEIGRGQSANDTTRTETADSLNVSEQSLIIEEFDEAELILDEEDLLLNGDEEELLIDDTEENLISPQESEVPSDDRGIADTALISIEPDDAKSTQEVFEQPAKMDNAQGRQEPSGASAEVVKPAIVEDVRSINFAKNLKEYRSPRRAMFMSLVIPGLGQAYVGNYMRAAAFGVAELGIIGGSIAFNAIGDREKRKARKFADTAYSITKFEGYYDTLENYIRSVYEQDSLDDSVESRVTEEMSTLYLTTDPEMTYTEMHRADYEKESDDYYRSIQLMAHVQGWNDAEPSITQIRENYEEGSITTESGMTYYIDTARYYFVDKTENYNSPVPGYSQNQEKFLTMVSNYDDYYRKGSDILFLLLLNHIGSAIEAGLSAKKHNENLLEKETFWQRLDFEQQWVYTGTQFSPGYSVRISF